jgi:hypothetical protein
MGSLKFYLGDMKNINFIKNIFPLVISGVVGSMVTILFFPLQKEVDQYYWSKQNNILLNQSIIEKRLELVDEFAEDFTRYDWCSIRVGVINKTNILEEDPIVCYHDASAKLLGLALRVKYYFGADVNNEFDNFSKQIQQYEEDIRLGDPEAESGKKLRNSASMIIELMQKTMLEKFSGP